MQDLLVESSVSGYGNYVMLYWMFMVIDCVDSEVLVWVIDSCGGVVL